MREREDEKSECADLYMHQMTQEKVKTSSTRERKSCTPLSMDGMIEEAEDE